MEGNGGTGTGDEEVYFETEPGTKEQEEKLWQATESEVEPEEEPPVSWILTSFLIIAGTVSLGVLAMASNVAVLGYVPGILLIVGLGLLATYTGFLIWEVYMDHRDEEIEGYGQAAAIIFGPKWGMVVQIEQSLLLFFFIAATALTAGEAIYSLAQEEVCLAIMAVVGALGGWLLSFPVYLKGVSLLSALSFFCIIIAIIMNITGVSRLDIGQVDDVAFPVSGTSLTRAFGSTINIIFAYAGVLMSVGDTENIRRSVLGADLSRLPRAFARSERSPRFLRVYTYHAASRGLWQGAVCSTGFCDRCLCDCGPCTLLVLGFNCCLPSLAEPLSFIGLCHCWVGLSPAERDHWRGDRCERADSPDHQGIAEVQVVSQACAHG
eukprot:scaffold1821_cov344-Pavlova_lutheri.AAC.20